MPQSLPDFSTNGNAADPMGLHQLERFGQRLVGGHGDRVHDHPAFEALHLAHRRRLFLDGEVAVKHADPAELRERDRHVRLGHGVHRRRQDRDIERDLAGKKGAGVRLARQDGRFERLQQNVVERQSERDFSGVVELGHIGP